jgi:hypothetical protein
LKIESKIFDILAFFDKLTKYRIPDKNSDAINFFPKQEVGEHATVLLCF